MKKLNPVVSILTATALAAALAAPITAVAANVRVIGVQAVNASATDVDYKDLGDIKMEVPIDELDNQDFFFLRLPTDFKINIPSAINHTTDLSGAMVTKPDGSTEPLIQIVGGADDPWNDGAASHLSVYQTNDNELKIVVSHAEKASSGGANVDTIIKISLGSVFVPGNADNTIKAVMEGKTGSAFKNESLIVANKGIGMVSISIDSLKTIPDGGSETLDTIRIKEDSPGALTMGNTSIKLKLPYGFEWENPNFQVSFVDGDHGAVQEITATRGADTRELEIHVPAATKTASYFTINQPSIRVKHSSDAQYGNIALEVSGSSSTNIQSLVIANYASYSTIATALNPQEVLAGRAGAQDADNTDMGEIMIQENAPGSLRAGGTILLELTEGVKWAVDKDGNLVKPPQLNASLSDLQGLQIDETIGNKGWELIGNSEDTIRAVIKTASNGTKGAKMVFDKGLLDLAADAVPGDIHALVSGTAGVSGDVGVIAKVIAPAAISIADSSPKRVQGGVQNQTLGDILIRENKAGAIESSGSAPYIRLTFDSGVKPTAPASGQIEVEGDLVLDRDGAITDVDSQGCWYIQLPVLSASTVPSTITLKGQQITVNRTVPEGKLMLSLNGSLVQTAGTYSDAYPTSNTVTRAAVADVIIPANGNVMNSAAFIIGSTSYTVNGEKKNLDTAPFIDRNGRTLLPVRAVAEALGAIVGWDPQDQRVTILKDGKAISVIVGSYVMNVNGVFIQNDSPAVNKNGRVFLPFRIIAEALGAKVGWDAVTQTVYLN